MYDSAHDESRIQGGESREQASLLLARIEDYVGPESGAGDRERRLCARPWLGFRHADRAAGETGQPPYDPADLLKRYLYGYSNQIRSSRRLEQEANRKLELIWLLACQLSLRKLAIVRYPGFKFLCCDWPPLITVLATRSRVRIGSSHPCWPASQQAC